MYKALFAKIKEALFSVLPITLIVVFASFTPLYDLSRQELTVFGICSACMIIGIALFNLGADLAMMPMGEYVGSGLAKTGNLKALLGTCFLLGVLITMAEPDLTVLADQVSAVMNSTVLIIAVGVGVGLFLLFSILKIVFKKSLASMLMLFYMALFALSALLIETGRDNFLPLSFDSGGVTTGPITVPFIMALGVGIATTIGGRNANENSFGLIALCSIGPMLAVLMLSLFSSGSLTYSLPDYSLNTILNNGIGSILASVAVEVFKALGLIVLFFLVLQAVLLKLPQGKVVKIFIGIAYTFAGLVLFLTSAAVGFVPVGFLIGSQLVSHKLSVIAVAGLVIGIVTVLAEPAIHVLNKQVEEITDGAVTKRSMLIALAIGVGVAIGLSLVRIVAGFSLLYYVIPGYFISLCLSLFVPQIYTAIAFDSGGVASGPLTSSFILPLAIGVCASVWGAEGVLQYAFGVVSMVAMAPLITIQVLGFKAIASRAVRERKVMKRILDADDEQIIYFEMK